MDSTTNSNKPAAKKPIVQWVGWGISILLTAFLLFSAMGKFTDFEGKEQMFAHLGWGIDVMRYIGVVEVIIALCYLIPRTAFVATILLTAYLGGAIATHLRVNDGFVFQFVLGVIAWIALGLRDCRVFAIAFK